MKYNTSAHEGKGNSEFLLKSALNKCIVWLKENFLPDKRSFLQEYFVYFKNGS